MKWYWWAAGGLAVAGAGLFAWRTFWPAKPSFKTPTKPAQVVKFTKTGQSQVAGGHAVLSRGTSGALVLGIQQAVGADLDGDFGPQTEAKVKAFQQAQGLTADGVVGEETWAAIEQLADVQQTPAESLYGRQPYGTA